VDDGKVKSPDREYKFRQILGEEEEAAIFGENSGAIAERGGGDGDLADEFEG
jgi:hypothetical protein